MINYINLEINNLYINSLFLPIYIYIYIKKERKKGREWKNGGRIEEWKRE